MTIRPEGTTEKSIKGHQEETQASISGAIPRSSAKCTPVPHPWRRSVKGIYLASCENATICRQLLEEKAKYTESLLSEWTKGVM